MRNHLHHPPCKYSRYLSVYCVSENPRESSQYYITGEQFELIFNPGHLNISQIGNEYEHTIQDGELSLEQLVSPMLGGRRKRRYTRKCKRARKCKATRNHRRTRR